MSMSEKNRIERELNGHTLQLGRILDLGSNHKHWDRMKKALVNKACHACNLWPDKGS